MPKFAANLTMLYTDLPFLERFEAAANAGFTAVEFLFPYDYSRHILADLLQSNGLQIVLHNLPAGDWAAGERGIACLPDRIEEFKAGIARAIDYATTLGCPRLNCLAGLAPQDTRAARITLVENLRFAAAELDSAGLQLLLEPVNTRDVPGFFVPRTDMALDIIDETSMMSIKLQYDIYHAQVMEGDIARTIETQLSRIGHIQIADNPGRHEPGTGELNYPYLFERIDALGYNGWIGCEYKPATTTAAGLGWFHPYRGNA